MNLTTRFTEEMVSLAKSYSKVVALLKVDIQSVERCIVRNIFTYDRSQCFVSMKYDNA